MSKKFKKNYTSVLFDHFTDVPETVVLEKYTTRTSAEAMKSLKSSCLRLFLTCWKSKPSVTASVIQHTITVHDIIMAFIIMSATDLQCPSETLSLGSLHLSRLAKPQMPS